MEKRRQTYAIATPFREGEVCAVDDPAARGEASKLSRSQVPTVRHYITRQKEHPQKIDSATEFELLLKRHGFELRD
jgi:hypothetical protein